MSIYHTMRFGQKSAIGSKHRYKILPTGYLNKVRQMGMQERLSHQMKIEKFDLPTEFIGQPFEFLHGKTMLGSIRLGTEQAVEITDIGYFKIATGYHSIIS